MYHRRIVLHTRPRSLRCWLARRLLGRAGYSFECVDAATEPGVLAEISKAVGREVAPPYVFVDDRPLGGLGTVRALAGSGQLEHVLRNNL
jgi:glutaredoxin